MARLIREDMEALDQFAGTASQSDDTPDDVEDFEKFSMGSMQPSCTLDALCHVHRDDTAFTKAASLTGLALTDLITSCKNIAISKSTTSHELTREVPKITFGAAHNSTVVHVTTLSYTSRVTN